MKPLSVLIISTWFPTPSRPAAGIFVERQTTYLQKECRQVMVVPTRVFPHLRIWKKIFKPGEFARIVAQWKFELDTTPQYREINVDAERLPVYYPRFTSPPRQVSLGVWGYFAYPFMRTLLLRLHQQYKFDLIHAHYALPEGQIANFVQKWMKAPVVISIHGSDLGYAVRANQLNRIMIRKVLRSASAILVNSTKTADGILQYCNSPEKIKLVRLGANPPPSDVSVASCKKILNILTVGYLIEQKGHAFMLNAIQALIRDGYKLHYTIVGDGPEEQNLRSMCSELGIEDCVSFEGYKSHEDVWPYFSKCDIFALPCWNEAFGLVYIEALTMGKPVIGCWGEGGPDDLHSLGDCIEMVKPRDVASLVEALKRLIDNPERREMMGRIGREIVQQYYSWERTAADSLEIYHQILENYKGTVGTDLK